ncbi:MULTISPECIES: DUF3016 domain-containing protein [unclassified Arsukibacterium]|uniref:DUF3016 domain-containing protein n=1 Tax=unclassified Arsukibacterium TaxID=2635278 RepID=UPI000C63244F|nr:MULTISPECIES: DUF3016 domain-containing protein [unclassified Arsukibacterium]MAA93950.1 hypothetical protein [Rheinheimera sp.]MBM33647.1 hypothetical protein [Rheinheimera sp.]HAW94489.1 DUF3016 domain-containing protein [Candidatus Azambacteria bacterium]
MKTLWIAFIVMAWAAPASSDDKTSAELALSWQAPEKFTDVRTANDSRSRFLERVQRNFEQVFQEMADKLPKGYSWQITVTDVDLAGEVDYFATNTGQAIRVIKEVNSPAIRFNHLLRDQYGEEVVSGEERLRDMSFMTGMTPRSHAPEFAFEKAMLQDWFKTELQPKLTEHAALPAKVSKP